MSATWQAAFGRAIRAEREFLGLSQTQLGERLRWSKSNISDIEAGETIVAVGILPELCVALECSVMDLLRRAGEDDKRAMRL